jgi:DNA-binding winged helix-turn-helix (wHTH) protein
MDWTEYGLLRFGVFEVDLRAQELRRRGRKVKLRGQPFQVLTLLLERAGEVVTREEFHQRLGLQILSSISTTVSTLQSKGFAKPWVTPPRTQR